MTNKLVRIALLATLLTLAPLAAAEETKQSDDTRPDDAAWVEDCPPDMMCAANQYGNGTDDCIDCSGPTDDTVWGTDCPEGAYCMMDGTGNGTATPDDGCDADACSHGGLPPVDDTTTEESSAGFAYLLLGLLATAFVATALRLRD